MGCASGGGKLGSVLPDASTANDTSVVMDATYLEMLSQDTAGGYWDTTLSQDISDVNDPGAWDASATDTLTLNDTYADTVTPDVGTADDTWNPACGACKDGYTCINGQCVFAAQCDTNGLTDADAINSLLNNAFIKIQGLVRVGKPSCSLQTCTQDNPCCQSCFAPLKLGAIELQGDGFSIGCLGTNCDFQKKCTPMKPNQAYIVWGKVKFSGFNLELHVQGFCLAKQ